MIKKILSIFLVIGFCANLLLLATSTISYLQFWILFGALFIISFIVLKIK